MKNSPNKGFPNKEIRDAWKSFSECGSIECYSKYVEVMRKHKNQMENGKPKDNLAEENVQCI